MTSQAGAVSMITFDNPDFWNGINKMFYCSKNERIAGIEIQNGSVKAFFNTD